MPGAEMKIQLEIEFDLKVMKIIFFCKGMLCYIFSTLYNCFCSTFILCNQYTKEWKIHKARKKAYICIEDFIMLKIAITRI